MNCREKTVSLTLVDCGWERKEGDDIRQGVAGGERKAIVNCGWRGKEDNGGL